VGAHGAQRLDLPADAPPLQCQRPQRASPPQLRPRHWRARPNLSPPGPSLQGCLLRQGIPPGRNIRSFRTSWRVAKTGRPSRENGCSVTSRRSACPAQDRCPAAPPTSSACRCEHASASGFYDYIWLRCLRPSIRSLWETLVDVRHSVH